MIYVCSVSLKGWVPWECWEFTEMKCLFGGARARASVCVCVCVCARARARVCVCACVCGYL